jgi:hypothetical protein
METFTPSFNSKNLKTLEEEVNFLRERLTIKENETDRIRKERTVVNETNPDRIINETIREYRELPNGHILHNDYVLPKEQSEAIVLELAPEEHDDKISELLGILQTHGIKNVLSIVEKMNDPHVQDDFERFLVQYLKAGLGDKYVEIFNKANFNTLSLTSDKFTYSKPDKSKEVFQIDNSKDGKIKGGLADKKFIDDFGLETLLKGIAVEKEHTDEVSVATEITMDHLTEDNDYYQKLEKVEKQ